MKAFHRSILPFLIMVLPVGIGAITMQNNAVSPKLWGQNLITLAIAGIASFLCIRKKSSPIIPPQWGVFFGILVLLFCFFNSGIQHVFRWISIGPITIYVGSLISPLLLIQFSQLIKHSNWWHMFLLSTGITSILFFQPDAAQTTAFGITISILLIPYVRHSGQYIALSIPLTLAGLSWYFIDNLEPVAYVEDILVMAKTSGIFIYGLSILSLLILPLPFFVLKHKKHNALQFSLGVYITALIISSQIGHFPVPLLGFGISPILGYTIAITWLMKSNK